MPVTVRNTDILFNDGSTQSTAASVIPSSFNAIGSVLQCVNWSTSNLLMGNTIAGSSLLYPTGGTFFPNGGSITLQGSIAYIREGAIQGGYTGNSGAIQPSNTTTLPGTWRVLSVTTARFSQWDGGSYNLTTIYYQRILVQRIS